MDNLEKFIEENAIPDYGMKLLKLNDAIKFIQLCKENNVKLLGFDGFYLHPNGKVQIEQSFSPDYSKNTTEESHKLALDFFAKQTGDNVGYEMVYTQEW